MAAAAKMTKGASKSKSRNGKPSDAKPSDGDPSNADENAEENDGLAELIEELDEAIEEWDRELEEMELEERDGDQDLEPGDDLDEADAAARAKLDELGDRLIKMARRRKARSKLKKLSKRISQMQSGAAATMESRRKGGLKAGKGSEDTTRDERDERVDNGQNTKLKGLKGKGPSLTQVQAADDGDGTSYRRSEAKERDYQRQFESFVDREDIPEDLKNGVKEYFTNIHQGENAEADPPSEDK
jgi:hypothetical protein